LGLIITWPSCHISFRNQKKETGQLSALVVKEKENVGGVLSSGGAAATSTATSPEKSEEKSDFPFLSFLLCSEQSNFRRRLECCEVKVQGCTPLQKTQGVLIFATPA